MRSCNRPLARRHRGHQRLYGLYRDRHFNFMLSTDGQRRPVWNHRLTGEQRIRWMRKHCPASATESVRSGSAAAAATESVRPAATTLHGSEPVLQRGLDSAASAATGVHGSFAGGSKRAMAEERRIGVTTVQFRLHTIGCTRDAFVSIQPVVWNSGTVCVIDAGKLRPAASYRERCMARASFWGHYGHAAVQFRLHRIFGFWWNRGVQRWRVVCVNSVQRRNRHAVQHSSAMRSEQRPTRAAGMLGAPADDFERRLGSGATRRGGDSAMQPGLRVERRCITDRVPPRWGFSVRGSPPAGHVGPISCIVRISVRAAAPAAAPHWTGVLRDSRRRAERRMDGPGDYRHATVQPVVHWHRHCPVCQRRVGIESVQPTEVLCISAAATPTAPYPYLHWSTGGDDPQRAAGARPVDGSDWRHDGHAAL